MHEWNDTQRMMRDMLRQFVEREIKPQREALEHGDMLPYPILRKLIKTFGMDAMARERFKKQIEREEARARGEPDGDPEEKRSKNPLAAEAAAMTMIPIIE